MMEIYGNASHGTDYFGADPNHNAVAGYGKHVQTLLGSSCVLSDGNSVFGTCSRSDDNPSLTTLAYYWAWSAY